VVGRGLKIRRGGRIALVVGKKKSSPCVGKKEGTGRKGDGRRKGKRFFGGIVTSGKKPPARRQKNVPFVTGEEKRKLKGSGG